MKEIHLSALPVSSNQVVREREALEELLKTEGWQVFLRHCTDEWKGDGFFQQIGISLRSNNAVDPAVVHRTALAVERLLQWPVNRLNELQGVTDE